MGDAALPRKAWNTARIAALAWRERRLPYRSAKRVGHLQRRRLRSIVRHAHRTVPFYREAMDERGLSPAAFREPGDLARLPLVDSRHVRLNVERFASSLHPPDRTFAMRSSGSTNGVRKVVRWDRRSLLLNLATSARDRAVVERLAGGGTRLTQAIVLPSESQSLAIQDWLAERTLRPGSFGERSRIPADLPPEEVARRLEAIRPDVVYTYGSNGTQLLQWLMSGGGAMAVPRVWVYASDALPAAVRERAERELGVAIVSTYQTVETARLGFECEMRSGFHLNVDRSAVRVVDADGRDLPPGEVGEVVVSNLVNRATVLLNYRLGDLAALSAEPCPCGRSLPLLAGLEGRVSEVVRGANGREVTGLTLLNMLRDELAFAIENQIVHPAPGRVVLRVVPSEWVDLEARARRLEARCREELGAGTQVETRFVERIERTPAGKVLRMVDEDSGA